MAYGHTTYLQLRQLVANRLSDPNNVQFPDAELKLHVTEALRTWGLVSGFYSDRDSFPTVNGQFYYDLTSVLTSGLLSLNVKDSTLVQQIKYHLIEPLPADTATFTDQISLTDFTNALEKRRNQFLLETGCLLAYTPTFATGATPVSRVALADTVIDVRRAAWLQGGVYYWLPRKDEFVANALSVGWQGGTSGTNPPGAFSLVLVPPVTMQIIPPANTSGTLDLLTVSTGAALNPVGGVLLGIPDDFTPYIKWGALADILGKDGQMRDQARSQYCEQRWQEGLAIAKAIKSVEQVAIGNSVLWLNSIRDFDGYNYGWQNQTGTPVRGGLGGWNMLALHPVPTGVQTVTVDLIRNTPLPVLNGDFVQIGREQVDVVADYAVHLAAFKMGGAEFFATIPHYQRMFRLAAENGKRLQAIASQLDVLRTKAKRMDYLEPRKRGDDEAAA